MACLRGWRGLCACVGGVRAWSRASVGGLGGVLACVVWVGWVAC